MVDRRKFEILEFIISVLSFSTFCNTYALYFEIPNHLERDIHLLRYNRKRQKIELRILTNKKKDARSSK